MEDINRILATLDSIESVEVEGELARLDEALQALRQTSHPERGIDVLFRIYERFPDSDGYGIFWSILTALEAMPGYEHRLIESVQRQPMAFNLLMVNRLLNVGITHFEEMDLLALLERSAANPQSADAVREEARNFVAWQRSRM